MSQITKPVPALSASSNGTTQMITMQRSGSVSSVTYTPNATITGQNTNSRTLYLVNSGPQSAGGSGSPMGISVMATVPLTSGVVLNGGQANAIPLTSATSFKVGDQIAWSSDAVGTGLADPGGSVTATY